MVGKYYGRNWKGNILGTGNKLLEELGTNLWKKPRKKLTKETRQESLKETVNVIRILKEFG